MRCCCCCCCCKLEANSPWASATMGPVCCEPACCCCCCCCLFAEPAVPLSPCPGPGPSGSRARPPCRPHLPPLGPPLPAPLPLAAWPTPVGCCVCPSLSGAGHPPVLGGCCWGSAEGAFLLACMRCSSVMVGNSSAALAFWTMACRSSASSSRACHTGFFCTSSAPAALSAGVCASLRCPPPSLSPPYLMNTTPLGLT